MVKTYMYITINMALNLEEDLHLVCGNGHKQGCYQEVIKKCWKAGHLIQTNNCNTEYECFYHMHLTEVAGNIGGIYMCIFYVFL